MIASWSNLTITSFKELNWTEILGQMRIKYHKEFWEMTFKILSQNIRRKLKNCGVDMLHVQSRIHTDYDSAESIADSDLEDGELREMLDSPLHVHGRGGNYGSSRKPTASGKPEAKITQKGQVHNVLKLITREERAWSQIHLKTHARLENRMKCFHQGATNWEISSKVPCSNMLIRQNWEDLFLKVIKITCSVRQDLNLWDKSIKVDLSMRSRIGITGRSSWIYFISKRTSSTTRRIFSEGKLFRDTQIRNIHELGEMTRVQELRGNEFSVRKLRESQQSIQRLTSQLQSMQKQTNSMNDSGECQEVESNHSGRLFHVPSQPEAIPSSSFMLSRDKSVPFDAWDSLGLQENVFW